MGKLINEVGNRYGRLLVIKPIKVNNRTLWECKCDCGNIINVSGTSLRTQNTKSCGCLQKDKARSNFIDLTGKKFGLLTVLYRDEDKPKGHGKPVFWICKCECGNIISIQGNHLKSGHTKSCGCYKPKKFINEVGNIYGKLKVIEFIGTSLDGKALWKCQCECGNEKITLGKSLRAGLVQSCGCLHSKGEQKIASILTKNKINFIQQYHTDECKSNKNYYLYFDFYLPDYNLCIEYQGEQHYLNIDRGFFSKYNLEELQDRDNIKREFCKNKKIKLLEIPYWDFDKIDINYLLMG